ncbi:Oidioi.mRNA.OKI2018_I69.XSR.g16994.t1.cds [Oikopleura dioica]|uniref:small monomeric GTPase n=1 Tax=Oikopleura dioica TaxID=34765 RepID=A0ABN7SHU3_OIKDI|nr:Oidioi.mRNA.OKI2018_I69.XSR.g16994.t1.cds [Oikopleura dioica]
MEIIDEGCGDYAALNDRFSDHLKIMMVTSMFRASETEPLKPLRRRSSSCSNLYDRFDANLISTFRLNQNQRRTSLLRPTRDRRDSILIADKKHSFSFHGSRRKSLSTSDLPGQLKKQKSEKKFSIISQFRPSKPERDMKIIFWGAEQVGKSALLVRFVTGRYISEYSSLVNYTVTKTISTESNVDVKLEVTDPTSCANSGLLKKSSFDLLLLVFDLTNASSFRWIKERAERVKHDMKNNLSVVVLGNKKDLSSRREVSTEEARSFSEDNNWVYFEVSAAELRDSEEDDEELQDHDKSVYDALQTAVTELFHFRRNFGSQKKSSGMSKGGDERPPKRRSSTVQYIYEFASHARKLTLGSRS